MPRSSRYPHRQTLRDHRVARAIEYGGPLELDQRRESLICGSCAEDIEVSSETTAVFYFCELTFNAGWFNFPF